MIKGRVPHHHIVRFCGTHRENFLDLHVSTGEGNGNGLWYSCPENPMDRGTWQATGHGVAESDVTDIQSLVCCVF